MPTGAHGGAIGLPLGVRIALSVTAIFPLALPMGMLFPIGVRLLAQRSADVIPWAWATNGCFSVLGIFTTRIIALLVGFSRALLVGFSRALLVGFSRALLVGFSRALLVGLGVYLLVIACVRRTRASHSR